MSLYDIFRQNRQDQLIRDAQQRITSLQSRAITRIIRDESGNVAGLSDAEIIQPIVNESDELIPFSSSHSASITGMIMLFAGSVIPARWLACDGSVVLQSAYPDLFAVIGTTFNTGGEAPNEFRLPLLSAPPSTTYVIRT